MKTFGKQFYPTPDHIASKMVEKIGRKNFKRAYILDPSAGSGSLLEYVNSIFKYDNWGKPSAVHAVEIDQDLRSVLMGKNIDVVGEDFMQFSTNFNYDIILMNPPFADGAKHLLKAWQIAGSSEIVCLLNSETLNNPCTSDRQLLKKIIEDNNGTVEDLGDCFSNAARTTGVNVSMVYLKKEAASNFSFDPSNMERENHEFPEDLQDNMPAVNNVLKSYENSHVASINAFKELLTAWNKFRYYSKPITDGYYNDDFISFIKNNDFNGFVTRFNNMSWDKVLQKSKFKDYMTKDVKSEFTDKFAKQQNIAFTEQNMMLMFEVLWFNKDKILSDCAEEVFDIMTKYHKDNRVHNEGWKHNDAYMVSRKVVLPHYIGTNWSSKFKVERSLALNDIDRAMCHLTGKKIANISTVENVLEKRFAELGSTSYGSGQNLVESEFFKIRFFKKGTIHLEFKNKQLWETFNRTVALNKGWLMGSDGHSFKRKAA